MTQKFKKKSWGWELWFANVKDSADYCGKLLRVEFNKWSSKGRYHYHKIKDETFFVLKGQLLLMYMDESYDDLGIPKTIILNPEDSFRIKPGVKHKFSTPSDTGCEFIETSTFHSDADSYRTHYDIEKGEWVE